MEHKSSARLNCFARHYVEIAVRSMISAEQLFEQLKDESTYELTEYYYNEIWNHKIETVVFSFMAIESFINDYSCKLFGDDFFNEDTQQLAPLAKLQICYMFVTGKEIDKSSNVCYSHIKNLTKERNQYVHNKSSHLQGMTYEEMSENSQKNEADEIQDLQHDIIRGKKNSSKDAIQKAHFAIRTIYELSSLLDSIDKNVDAKFFLLGMNSAYSVTNPSYMIEIRKRFQ